MKSVKNVVYQRKMKSYTVGHITENTVWMELRVRLDYINAALVLMEDYLLWDDMEIK